MLAVVFFILVWFLGKELLKKFKFLDKFAETSGWMERIDYKWICAGRKPGMRKIVLSSKQPFSVLIGFKLRIPIIRHESTDCFGFVEAKKTELGNWLAIISTYMGKKTVDFSLFIKRKSQEELVTLAQERTAQEFEETHASYPPHWYQRLGFYV
jgi:hypothetical protein